MDSRPLAMMQRFTELGILMPNAAAQARRAEKPQLGMEA